MTARKIIIGTKTCNTCNIEKEYCEFWKQKSNKDGLFGECKKCSSQRNVNWIDKNRIYAAKKNNIYTRKRRLHDPKKALFFGAKYRAKRDGIDFSLNPDDFTIPEFCPILGIPLKTKSGMVVQRKGNWHDDSPSLERIDNTIGYVKENVVIVSVRANRIKSNASIEELNKISSWYNALRNNRKTIPTSDTDISVKDREQSYYMSAMLSFSA